MNIRKIIKEEIDSFDWVSQHMETVPDDPHHLALAKCYGDKVLRGMEQESSYRHYTIDVYENEDGEEYAVGTTEEFWESLKDYYSNLLDEVGVEGWNDDVTQYMWMSPTDIRFWASDLADNDIESYGQDEMVNQSTYSDDMDEVNESISELENTISEKEDVLISYDEDSPEYEELDDEIDSLKDDLQDLETKKEIIYHDARQEFYDEIYNKHKDALEDNPVDYLVHELGLYESLQDLYDNNILNFDSERFAEDLANQRGYGELSGYDGEYCMEHINGEDYICIRIN